MSRLHGYFDVRLFPESVMMTSEGICIDDLCNGIRKNLCEIKGAVTTVNESASGILKILSNRRIFQTGKKTKISTKKMNEIFQVILNSVRARQPLEIFYTWSLGKSPNPNKCVQFGPDLAEIFGIQRLLDLEHTLRQARPEEIYPLDKPTVIFNIINEHPAMTFVPGVTDIYCREFKEQFEVLLNKHSAKNIIKIMDLDDLLWGTDQRKQEWEIYSNKRSKEYRGFVRSNIDSPEKRSIQIATYTMITFINIFSLPGTNLFTPQDVQLIYDYSRNALIDGFVASPPLPDYLKVFYLSLIKLLTPTAISYLVVKDAYKNSSFWHEKSQDSITISNIDKNDCIIFHPISNKTVVNPMHGTGVKTKDGRVTVRFLLNILSEHDSQSRKYKNMFNTADGKTLYFQEI